MAKISKHLRSRALAILQGRLVTITTAWEEASTPADQGEWLRLEVHRLVGTASQGQFLDIAQAGRLLEQRLGGYFEGLTERRAARALVSDALYALQATMVRTVAQHTAQSVRPEAERAHGELSTDERPLVGLRVLLVEDSGDLAGAFQEGLRLAGCAHVACCGTVAAAQALLAPGQPPFDIALIDHNLGLARGSTLAAWMRQQPHLAHTQRISYSASPRERVIGASAPGDFHAVLGLRGLRGLIADLAAVRTLRR